jgi:flagellar basal-body rod modification protein FlgD
MSIDAITGNSGTTGTGTTGTTGTGLQGNKQEFLRLFMAQLQHQDPLDPTSGADMVAQLAQMGSVEQATIMNQQLAELVASQASNASASLANLVGRDCAVAVGDVTMQPTGTPPPISLTSDKSMDGAHLVITDAEGKEIRRIDCPPTKDGVVQWDGLDANGERVPAGNYRITVEPGEKTGSITANWTGIVDAVELTPDGPRLRMGGVLIAPGDVRTIGQSAGDTPQGASS